MHVDLKQSVRALRHACRLICSCAQAEWLKQLMTFCCEILKCFLMPHTPIASLVSRDFRYFLVAYIPWLPQVGPATYVHSSSWSIPTNNSPTRYEPSKFSVQRPASNWHPSLVSFLITLQRINNYRQNWMKGKLTIWLLSLRCMKGTRTTIWTRST